MKVIDLFLVLLYNFSLVAGTVYLVGWKDWSGWWFLFTALLIVNYTVGDKNE